MSIARKTSSALLYALAVLLGAALAVYAILAYLIDAGPSGGPYTDGLGRPLVSTAQDGLGRAGIIWQAFDFGVLAVVGTAIAFLWRKAQKLKARPFPSE